jgi:hypothetical protein
MPEYAMLLYGPAPGDPADAPPEELEAHGKHGEEVERLGIKVTGAYALQPSTTATAVRDRGETVTDGPFVEAKEVMFGFFVVEARDLDHALEVAKSNPATWRGGVEVRPLFVPPAE